MSWYKVQQWRYSNSAQGERRDFTLSPHRIRIPSFLSRRRYVQHPLELRNLSSIYRAKRMIKAYGLANEWEWMVTFTFDQTKLDRIRIRLPKKRGEKKPAEKITLQRDSPANYIMLAMAQYIRSLRKKYGSDIGYLLIPEFHDDGSCLHWHGLMNNIPLDRLDLHWRPDLAAKQYLNWPDIEKKFGLVTLGHVRDTRAAVLYSLKYISKDLHHDRKNDKSHLYYVSHNLKLPELLKDGSDLLWLPDEWLYSNVYMTEYACGSVRSVTPVVADELLEDMRFQSVQRLFEESDVRMSSQEFDQLVPSLPAPLESVSVYDLFGNERIM